MSTIDTGTITKLADQFVAERDWDQFHSIKNLSMALSVESSELLEIFQWLTEEQSNQVKLDPKLKTKVKEEVADIFIYLLRLANKAGINLEQAALEKIQLNSQKYPVEKSKGNAKKYNEI